MKTPTETTWACPGDADLQRLPAPVDAERDGDPFAAAETAVADAVAHAWTHTERA